MCLNTLMHFEVKFNLDQVIIWNIVKKDIAATVLRGDLIRVVESQEQVASNQLVDSLEEQKQLEELLEQSKPAFRVNSEKLHYLLATPFRYPPLMHGSRFGSRFEPSLFYASKHVTTAFAETAYYRFFFWRGMVDASPSGKFLTEHTVFHVGYYSTKGLKLQNLPFSKFESELTNPSRYKITQQLGSDMRMNGIDIFEYVSARDNDHGINIGLFNPGAFVAEKPKDQQQWLCETTAEKVSFSIKNGKLYSYPLGSFLADNAFPVPAS